MSHVISFVATSNDKISNKDKLYKIRGECHKGQKHLTDKNILNIKVCNI